MEQITCQKNMTRKKFKKNNLAIALNVLYVKNDKIFQNKTFENITQSMEKKLVAIK